MFCMYSRLILLASAIFVYLQRSTAMHKKKTKLQVRLQKIMNVSITDSGVRSVLSKPEKNTLDQDGTNWPLNIKWWVQD